MVLRTTVSPTPGASCAYDLRWHNVESNLTLKWITQFIVLLCGVCGIKFIGFNKYGLSMDYMNSIR